MTSILDNLFPSQPPAGKSAPAAQRPAREFADHLQESRAKPVRPQPASEEQNRTETGNAAEKSAPENPPAEAAKQTETTKPQVNDKPAEEPAPDENGAAIEAEAAIVVAAPAPIPEVPLPVEVNAKLAVEPVAASAVPPAAEVPTESAAGGKEHPAVVPVAKVPQPETATAAAGKPAITPQTPANAEPVAVDQTVLQAPVAEQTSGETVETAPTAPQIVVAEQKPKETKTGEKQAGQQDKPGPVQAIESKPISKGESQPREIQQAEAPQPASSENKSESSPKRTEIPSDPPESVADKILPASEEIPELATKSTSREKSPETSGESRQPGNGAAPLDPAGNIAAAENEQTVRLPRHLLAAGGKEPVSRPAVNSTEQARILQRVARAFEAAQQRGGEVRIRLTPPHLGSVRLELKVEAGVMTARVEAETQTARAVLLDNLPALRDRLAEQGIRIEQFNVDISDQRGQEEQAASQQQHRRRQPLAETPGAAAEEENRTVIQTINGNGEINVII